MSEKVNVYVRIKSTNNQKTWVVKGGSLYQKVNDEEVLVHTCFKKVYEQVDNTKLYLELIKNSVKSFLDYKKCTIFAYGQTGSGKTYTMMGENFDGIICQSLKDIFDCKKEDQKIGISYLEIYNENLFDLIENNNKPQFFSKNKDLLIKNLENRPIQSYEEALEIISASEKRRKVSKTEFNERSSRSHTILRIEISNKGRKSLFNLIDLAGSEKASLFTERRKESAFINKSLLALGSLIMSIDNSSSFYNFRDSKLTRLLQPSLEGDCNILSLCMINPEDENLSESLSTLNFASRLSNIKMNFKKEKLVDFDNIMEEKCLCTQKKETKTSNTYELGKIRLENDVLKKRIKNLELIICKVIENFPSSNIEEIFLIEKNLFEIEMGRIKGKYLPSKEDVFEL